LYVCGLILAVEHWLMPLLSLQATAEGFYSNVEGEGNAGLGAGAGVMTCIPARKLEADMNVAYRAHPFRGWPEQGWHDPVAFIMISKQKLFATR
jgi:hypothetical protein